MFSAIAFLMLLNDPVQLPHVGSYIPNSQLLSWCKSQDEKEYASCWTFISGVIESAGKPDVRWPKGAIELPSNVRQFQTVPSIVAYIEKLGAEKMSSPAVDSVYEAVVVQYPHEEVAAPKTK